MTPDTDAGRREAAERAIEHDADELEHRIDQLGEDIDDAEKKLADRREDAGIAEDVAGDWEGESSGGAPSGEDPAGAVDDERPT